MKTDELFGVVVRGVGVWEFAIGVRLLPGVAGSLVHYDNDREFFFNMFGVSASMAGVSIVVGLFLFFGANWFVRLAYPEGTSAEGAEEIAPSP